MELRLGDERQAVFPSISILFNVVLNACLMADRLRPPSSAPPLASSLDESISLSPPVIIQLHNCNYAFAHSGRRYYD